ATTTATPAPAPTAAGAAPAATSASWDRAATVATAKAATTASTAAPAPTSSTAAPPTTSATAYRARASPTNSAPARGTEPQSRSSQPHRLADDLLHDLVGAAPDWAEAGVADGALDSVLAHVAVAAVDLEGLVGDAEGGALGEELGDRDLAQHWVTAF